MNIAGASAKLFTSSVFNTAVGFLGVTFFARELGAAQLGVFFLFEAVLGLLAVVADFGLRGAVEKRISEGRPGGEILGTALAIKAVPIAGAAVVLVLASGLVNGYVGADIAGYLFVGLVLRELAETQQTVLSGEERVGETAAPEVARQVVWVGVGIVLVLKGYGVVGLIYGLLLGWTVMFLWSRHRSEIPIGRPTLRSGRSLFEFSKYHVVSKVQGYAYSWIDVVIIGIFLTQTEVGAYEVAWRVTEATVLLSNAVALAVFPRISRWHAKGRTDQIGDLISNSIVPTLVLVIPAFGGVLLLSADILEFVFGPEYVLASLVLVILSGEKVLQALYRLFHRGIHGIDRPDLAARTVVLVLLTNVILNLLFVRRYGIEGIAVATTVSFVLGTFLHGRDLLRSVPLRFPGREVGWCVLATVLMMAGVEVIGTRFPVDSLVSLLLLAAFGVLLYGSLLVLYPPLWRRLQRTLRALLP